MKCLSDSVTLAAQHTDLYTFQYQVDSGTSMSGYDTVHLGKGSTVSIKKIISPHNDFMIEFDTLTRVFLRSEHIFELKRQIDNHMGEDVGVGVKKKEED